MPGTGGEFEPSDGGATPIIVPLSFGFGPAGAGAEGPGGAAAGAAGAAGAGADGPGAAGPPGRGTAAGAAFIMSIVPLNFGAAVAGFSAKPHFAHAVAVSRFWAPQFGQNTKCTSCRISQCLGEAGGQVTRGRRSFPP